MPANGGCPHISARFCPLYRASHSGDGIGCDDGRLEEGGCAVARGMDYTVELARLEMERPGIAAEAEWAERKESALSQRARNMRHMGIR